MLPLLIDTLVAWLLVRFVPAGVKRMLLGLVGGWVAALAGVLLVGFAFGWTPIDMLSRLSVGLLVHPLVVAGLIWLFTTIRNRRKGRAGTN
jgi:Na+/citrate or Na+/malate symporter